MQQGFDQPIVLVVDARVVELAPTPPAPALVVDVAVPLVELVVLSSLIGSVSSEDEVVGVRSSATLLAVFSSVVAVSWMVEVMSPVSRSSLSSPPQAAVSAAVPSNRAGRTARNDVRTGDLREGSSCAGTVAPASP